MVCLWGIAGGALARSVCGIGLVCTSLRCRLRAGGVRARSGVQQLGTQAARWYCYLRVRLVVRGQERSVLCGSMEWSRLLHVVAQGGVRVLIGRSGRACDVLAREPLRGQQAAGASVR